MSVIFRCNKFVTSYVLEAVHELLSNPKQNIITVELTSAQKLHPIILDTLRFDSCHILSQNTEQVYKNFDIENIQKYYTNMSQLSIDKLLQKTILSLWTLQTNEPNHIVEPRAVLQMDVTKVKDNNVSLCEKYIREQNIFISERDYTYPKMYDKFTTLDDIPQMFSKKFTVYLFLDGKDMNKNDVRKKYLGTPDDYKLFRLLYDSINDDDFVLPSNLSDIELLAEFADALPQTDLCYEDMPIISNEWKEIFEEVDMSQCSGDESYQLDSL